MLGLERLGGGSPFKEGGQMREPGYSFRLHHFQREDLRLALNGIYTPESLARQTTEGLSKATNWAPGYRRDVFDPADAAEMSKFASGMAQLFSDVARMPGDTLVRLDSKPDPICGGCAIGQHCTAVNFPVKTEIDATTNAAATHFGRSEQRALNEIVAEFKSGGFREGIHFMREPTFYTLRDFEERELGQEITGEPITIMIDNLLVWARVLRAVPIKRLEVKTETFGDRVGKVIENFGKTQMDYSLGWDEWADRRGV